MHMQLSPIKGAFDEKKPAKNEKKSSSKPEKEN